MCRNGRYRSDRTIFEAEHDLSQPIGFGAIVCNMQHRDLSSVPQSREQFDEMIARLVIEGAKGFIEQ
jgi:hypothetical protein